MIVYMTLLSSTNQQCLANPLIFNFFLRNNLSQNMKMNQAPLLIYFLTFNCQHLSKIKLYKYLLLIKIKQISLIILVLSMRYQHVKVSFNTFSHRLKVFIWQEVVWGLFSKVVQKGKFLMLNFQISNLIMIVILNLDKRLNFKISGKELSLQNFLLTLLQAQISIFKQTLFFLFSYL